MAVDGLIEPHSFDVIVLGTGLQEAIIAAAAAASRLSVLHLDPHDFYGAHWTSFDFDQFCSWAANGGRFPVPPSAQEESAHDSPAVDAGSNDTVGDADASGHSTDIGGVREETHSDDHSSRSAGNGCPPEEQPIASVSGATLGDSQEDLGLREIDLECGKSSFSEVKVCEHGLPLGPSRLYSIDLCGPRLTLCGSELVNLLIRSGASNYLDFKGNDASYIWTGTGLCAVPSSRADVFKDKSLSLPDKRYLMRFFSLVTDFATAEDQSTVGITDEDLDCSFPDFLLRQRLPTLIQSIILYAIALMDGDQGDDVRGSTSILRARDGLQKLALYLSSVARFPNARGAFIYPFYGQGEFPQAFCRSAAVNGALYVLRRPVKSLLINKDSKEYRGVRTSQGQRLFSKKLILGPSYLPVTSRTGHQSSENQSQESTSLLSASAAGAGRKGSDCQVARLVCVTDCSLVEGQDTMLVIFPPNSVREGWSSVIRALQLSSTSSVCPKDKYIIYLSTPCNDVADGREVLEAVVQILFRLPESGNVDVEELDRERVNETNKPTLLWSAFYVQALQTSADDLRIPGVSVCKMPDETVDYEDMLTSSKEIFRDQFPDLEFLPKSGPEDAAHDDEDHTTADAGQDEPAQS